MKYTENVNNLTLVIYLKLLVLRKWNQQKQTNFMKNNDI